MGASMTLHALHHASKKPKHSSRLLFLKGLLPLEFRGILSLSFQFPRRPDMP